MNLESKKKLKKQKRNILHLTLKRPPFDVMITGEKVIEFRKSSKWIESRLINSKTGKLRKYDFICFKNGYNMDSDFFYVDYIGFIVSKEAKTFTYSNGLSVDVEPGDILISFGKQHSTVYVLNFYNNEQN